MRALTLSYWPASTEYPLLETTCGDVLRGRVESHADHIALKEAHPEPSLRRSWTYAVLLQEAEAVAHGLLRHFSPGTHVAVWGSNRPEWVIIQFAISLAGMVMVTINPAYRILELAYVLRQSRCRGIFFQSDHRGIEMREAIAQALSHAGYDIELQVCFDELDTFGIADSRIPLPQVSPTEASMIQYTSGTTGQPKGAVLTHHGITNNSRIMAMLKGMNEKTINLAAPPLFHTGGCVGGVLATIQTGGTILLPDGFDAELMLDLVEQEKVSYTFAVPTMLIAMLETQKRKPRDLDSLRTVFTGGTIVPVDVVRRVEAQFEVCLIIGYGMTETSPAITHTRLSDTAEHKSETIGQPVPQVEVKIVDPGTGEIQPLGEPGELCTRGFHVMQGYFDMPEATAEAIDTEGWLHTGDLCTMDNEGYCRITGRLKDMIIRGGENVYPREIEEILYTHPAVAEVAVVGLPDQYWGEVVACVITLEANVVFDAGSVKSLLSEHLARHKLPERWYRVREIPMTLSGKIKKFRLVEQIQSGELEQYQFLQETTR